MLRSTEVVEVLLGPAVALSVVVDVEVDVSGKNASGKFGSGPCGEAGEVSGVKGNINATALVRGRYSWIEVAELSGEYSRKRMGGWMCGRKLEAGQPEKQVLPRAFACAVFCIPLRSCASK